MGSIPCDLCHKSSFKTPDDTVHLIKGSSTLSVSKQPFVQYLSDILRECDDSQDLRESDHLDICSPCFKLIELIDGLEQQVKLKRSEVRTLYMNRISTEDSSTKKVLENQTPNRIQTASLPQQTDSAGVTCPICQKVFDHKRYCMDHLKRTHKASVYSCDKCQVIFDKKKNLTKHKLTCENVLTEEPDCPQPPEQSEEESGGQFMDSGLTSAESRLHKPSETKAFTCSHCPKSFNRKAELQNHVRTHTGEKPFQCEFCGSSFAQKPNLRSHIRVVHRGERRHVCKECGAAYKFRRLLDFHIKSKHTGERPHVCQECGAAYVYPEHLRQHIRAHAGSKPFACDICDKRFATKDNRDTHRYVHSAKKLFECSKCGKGFMRKQHFYTHVETSGHGEAGLLLNTPEISAELSAEEEVQVQTFDETGVVFILPEGESSQEAETAVLQIVDSSESYD